MATAVAAAAVGSENDEKAAVVAVAVASIEASTRAGKVMVRVSMVASG